VSRPRDNEHVDAALRAMAASDPVPSADELAAARARLDVAIVADQPKRRHYRGRLAVAAGMAIVAMFVAGAVLWARPAPLVAALAEYAEVILETEPLQPAEGEFVLQRSELIQLAIVEGSLLPSLDVEELAYVIVEARETWVGADGIVEISSTPTEVQFFSDEAAAAYEADGMAEFDGIGVTLTVRQQGQPLLFDPPTDPDELEEALRTQLRLGGSDLPEDVQLFLEVASLVGDPQTSREVRAAAIQVLGSVRGLDLVDRDDARIVVAMEYEDAFPVSRTVELDLESSELIANTTVLLEEDREFGIPAGTILSQIRHEPLEVTTIGPADS